MIASHDHSFSLYLSPFLFSLSVFTLLNKTNSANLKKSLCFFSLWSRKPEEESIPRSHIVTRRLCVWTRVHILLLESNQWVEMFWLWVSSFSSVLSLYLQLLQLTLQQVSILLLRFKFPSLLAAFESHLFLRRDCKWVHLKSRLFTHEMVMVTQIHLHQNKFVLFTLVRS